MRFVCYARVHAARLLVWFACRASFSVATVLRYTPGRLRTRFARLYRYTHAPTAYHRRFPLLHPMILPTLPPLLQLRGSPLPLRYAPFVAAVTRAARTPRCALVKTPRCRCCHAVHTVVQVTHGLRTGYRAPFTALHRLRLPHTRYGSHTLVARYALRLRLFTVTLRICRGSPFTDSACWLVRVPVGYALHIHSAARSAVRTTVLHHTLPRFPLPFRLYCYACYIPRLQLRLRTAAGAVYYTAHVYLPAGLRLYIVVHFTVGF